MGTGHSGCLRCQAARRVFTVSRVLPLTGLVAVCMLAGNFLKELGHVARTEERDSRPIWPPLSLSRTQTCSHLPSSLAPRPGSGDDQGRWLGSQRAYSCVHICFFRRQECPFSPSPFLVSPFTPTPKAELSSNLKWAACPEHGRDCPTPLFLHVLLNTSQDGTT